MKAEATRVSVITENEVKNAAGDFDLTYFISALYVRNILTINGWARWTTIVMVCRDEVVFRRFSLTKEAVTDTPYAAWHYALEWINGIILDNQMYLNDKKHNERKVTLSPCAWCGDKIVKSKHEDGSCTECYVLQQAILNQPKVAARMLLRKLEFDAMAVSVPCPKCTVCEESANRYCYSCGRELRQ